MMKPSEKQKAGQKKYPHSRDSPDQKQRKAFWSENSIPGKIKTDIRDHAAEMLNTVREADIRKVLRASLPYVVFGYVFNKFTYVYRIAPGNDAVDKIINAVLRFEDIFMTPLPSFHPQDILGGILGSVLLYAWLWYRRKNAKKYRTGIEYGSARCGA